MRLDGKDVLKPEAIKNSVEALVQLKSCTQLS